MDFTTLEAMQNIVTVLENLGDRFLSVKIIEPTYFAQMAIRIIRYKDFSICTNIVIEAYGDGVIIVANGTIREMFDANGGDRGLKKCSDYIKKILED